MDIVVIVKRIDSSNSSPTGKLMDIGDKTALDMAVSLRDRYGHGNSTVSVLCIAPSDASEIIRECYSLGADTGYMLSDPLFESIDLNGLIELLYGAIKYINKCDLLVLASPSDDTVLVEVGKKLADMLQFKHYSGVDVFEGSGSSRVALKNKTGQREVVETPLLVNIACDLEQKIHNAMRIMKAYKKEIKTINSRDLAMNKSNSNNQQQQPSRPERVERAERQERSEQPEKTHAPHHRKKTVKQ